MSLISLEMSIPERKLKKKKIVEKFLKIHCFELTHGLWTAYGYYYYFQVELYHSLLMKKKTY